jgi:hypothetical protein
MPPTLFVAQPRDIRIELNSAQSGSSARRLSLELACDHSAQLQRSKAGRTATSLEMLKKPIRLAG